MGWSGLCGLWTVDGEQAAAVRQLKSPSDGVSQDDDEETTSSLFWVFRVLRQPLRTIEIKAAAAGAGERKEGRKRRGEDDALALTQVDHEEVGQQVLAAASNPSLPVSHAGLSAGCGNR